MNVFHIFCSDLSKIPRLIKSIEILKHRVDQFYIIGIHSEQPHYLFTGKNINVCRLKSRLSNLIKIKNLAFLRYFDWYIRCFIYCSNKKISVIHSHSIEDLPIAVLLKFVKKGTRLIYEPHELETKRTGWFDGPRTGWIQ